EKTPVSIRDVLLGSKRPAEERFPTCLVIDYDNAAELDAKSGGELNDRTGTPLFIARSVSLGTVLLDHVSIRGRPMPRLTGDALQLYTAVYGEERYDGYNDQPAAGTWHGGRPPMTLDPDRHRSANLPAFVHRPEHDVESVYWTMVYALLRAQPITAPKEDYAPPAVAIVWQILLAHHIPPQQSSRKVENRDKIIYSPEEEWLELFCADMQDVGVLLWEISQHVRSEYALWEGALRPDHLHEAVQRLILQYLVDHREKDIKLDPSRRRPTAPRSAHQGDTPTPTQLSRTQATGGTGNHTRGQVGSGRGSAASRNRGRGKGSRYAANRKGGAKTTAAAGGPSQQSVHSREQATTNEPVANSKRKSSSKPSRSSKRLKTLSGEPVSSAGQGDDDNVDGL
ncbi:hypothetical protein BD311DRAFT_169894, partial [Dichomitus squalens]